MADDPVIPTIESLGEVQEKTNTISSTLGGIVDKISKMSDGIKLFGTSLESSAKDASEFTSTMAETALKVDSITTGMMRVGTAFNSIKGTEGFNPINKQVDSLVEKLTSSKTNVKDFLKSFMGDRAFNESGFLGMASTQIIKALKDQANLAGQNQIIESSFLQTMAAGGQLGKVYESLAGEVSGLTELSAQYQKHVLDVAHSTGMEASEVAKFSTVLGQIPGALYATVNVGDKAGGSINALAAASKIAAGTGRGLDEVLKDITDGSMNLSGSNGLQSVEASLSAAMRQTTLMTDATSKLGARFEDVHGYMKTTADQFKYVGNNAEAAANLVTKYGSALMQTGLSSKTSIEMVGQMTSRLGELSLQTKAFLSQQSGGRGGLQGAFQIDKLLREGKLDEVMDMAQKSMKKQFGGKIVSLDQAASDPAAAAQMTKQLAILKQGPLGQFAKSDAEAYRLMESMTKTGPGRGRVLSGTDSLQKTTAMGGELQDRYSTTFNHMNILLEKQTAYQRQIAEGVTRNLFGADSKNKGVKEYNRLMKEDVGEVGSKTARIDRMSTQRNTVHEEAGKTAAGLLLGAKSFGNSLEEGGKDFMKFVKPLKAIFEENYKNLLLKYNKEVKTAQTTGKEKPPEPPELKEARNKLNEELNKSSATAEKTKKDKMASVGIHTPTPSIPTPKKLGELQIPVDAEDNNDSDEETTDINAVLAKDNPFAGREAGNKAQRSRIPVDAAKAVDAAKKDASSDEKQKVSVEVSGTLEGICINCGTKGNKTKINKDQVIMGGGVVSP